MVGWRVPADRVETVGRLMAADPEVTHCYERAVVPGRWEHNLFTVLHQPDRLSLARRLAEPLGPDGVRRRRRPGERARVQAGAGGPDPRDRRAGRRAMIRISRLVHGREPVSQSITHGNRHGEGGPVVFWNLTARCNLRCVHCYLGAGPDSSTTGELTTPEALALLDELAAVRAPVVLFSGGEPLLRPDLEELAAHARSLGLATALSTNGTLITPEVAARLRDAGFEYVGISLDGESAETHDALRRMPGELRPGRGGDAALRRGRDPLRPARDRHARQRRGGPGAPRARPGASASSASACTGSSRAAGARTRRSRARWRPRRSAGSSTCSTGRRGRPPPRRWRS